MSIAVHPQPRGFGAAITGVRLSDPISPSLAAELREAWLAHQVIFFPDQPMSHEDLERFTLCFGPFGNDPYVKAIPQHPNILEVRREPKENVAPFGASWHSDWSFQAKPPAATILHAKVVPPVGGETWYADGYDVVIGSRGSTREGFSVLRKVGSVVFRGLRSSMLLRGIKDTQCGFKSCKRPIALELFPKLEVFARAEKR